MKKIFQRIYFFIIAWVLVPISFVNGQIPENQEGFDNPANTGFDNPTNVVDLQNPISSKNLQDFLKDFLDILIQIAFPFIVLAVIYTGFLFVKAQGNPEELQTAKRAFMWTVIGALLLLGAVAISELILGTINEIRR